MKTRSGFVSNSSSSSFIVALDGNKTEVELKVKVDLAALGDIVTTEADLRDRFIEEWGEEELEEDEWVKERYEKCLEAIKKGKTIIIGSVCNDSGEAEETFIYDRGLPKADGMEIIQNAE